MKSKTSLFNKAVFKRNLTGYTGLWAGISILYLLLMPFNIYISLINQARYMSDELKANAQVWKENAMIMNMWNNRFAFVVIIAAAAVITAMFVFSYLFTGRNANMMHTFPVSRMSLFCTNYVTGLLFLIVPHVISTLLALLAGASMGAVTGAAVKCYLFWILTGGVESIFFFSLAVCVLMFSGNIVAVPVFYVILNFLYSGCAMIVEAMMDAVCYGVSGSVPSGGILTPLLYMRRHIGVTENVKEAETGWSYSVFGGNVLAIYLAAAVVFVIIAVIAYQKKHIETAGDVITVGWLKPIFRWGASVCTSALGALFIAQMMYGMSFHAILTCACVIGVVVFFAAQMLLERSMRVFTKKRIRECVIYTVCVCAVYIGFDADLLGIESKVPALDEVVSVSMRGYTRDADIVMYAEEAGEISWVQDIHKQIAASRKELQRAVEKTAATGGYLHYVCINYTLKDGTSLRRDYNLPENQENADSILEQVTAYAGKPEIILKQYFGIHYPDIEVYGASFMRYSKEGTQTDVRIYEEDAQKLYEAMVKDVQAGHFAGANEADDYEIGTQEVTGTVSDCELCFYIRDEKGLQFPGDVGYYLGDNKAEAQPVWLSPQYEYLIKALRELGYLEGES